MKARKLVTRAIVVAGLLGLWLPASSQARTWIINPGGTGDAPTIQAGIDSAAAGDSVLLENGTFSGPGNRNISFRGKAILVASLHGDWGDCMIDCGGSAANPHTGFIADQGESTTTVLTQVGIENGYAEYGGGGLLCLPGGEFGELGGCPIIQNCGFVNCTSADDGGAIMVGQFAHPLIASCWFTGNSAAYDGGAIYVESGAAATIDGCEFEENSAYRGGAVAGDADLIALSNCRFMRNRSTGYGGAMYFYLAGAELTGCTSIGNRSLSNGGSIYAVFATWGSNRGLSIVGSTFIADSSVTLK